MWTNARWVWLVIFLTVIEIFGCGVARVCGVSRSYPVMGCVHGYGMWGVACLRGVRSMLQFVELRVAQWGEAIARRIV
jgi:hypothetical protein